MTDLIAFDIYRTELLKIKDKTYEVNFTKRKNSEEYNLIAINPNNQKQFHASYSVEIADDFKKSTGDNLAEVVYQILKNDIERAESHL